MAIKQHKLMAMGVKVTGQTMPSGNMPKGMANGKGVKGDPKATPALMSKGKKNA